MDSLRQIEEDMPKDLHEMQRDVDRLRREASDPNFISDSADKSVDLPASRRMRQHHATHRNTMRLKERQITRTRDKTLDAILDAVRRGGDNPTRLRNIQARGNELERVAMMDMQRLRAVQKNTLPGYAKSKRAQWEMMRNAAEHERRQLMKGLDVYGRPEFSEGMVVDPAERYRRMLQRQNAYLGWEREEQLREMENRRRHVEDLRAQLPRFDRVLNATNSLKGDGYDSLRTKIDRDRRETYDALDRTERDVNQYARDVRATDSLMAANAAVTQQLQQAVQQAEDGSFAIEEIRRAAQRTPDSVEEDRRYYDLANSGRRVQTSAFVNGPVRHDNLVLNHRTGAVGVQGAGGRTLTFGVDQIVNGKMADGFRPTVARMSERLSRGGDLIVISYGYESRAKQSVGMRYITFLNALKEVEGKLRSMSQAGQISMQLVRITEGPNQTDSTREDLFTGQALPLDCKYEECGSSKQPIGQGQSATEIVNALLERSHSRAAEIQGESHLVLTLSVANSPGVIHITDVLYSDLHSIERQVLDQAWTRYLLTSLHKKSTSVDLLYNLSPDPDDESRASNEKMIQVAETISRFFEKMV